MVRLCVFELALACGHLATAAVTGWHPVRLACCDRLGGTISGGIYVAFAAEVDYVHLLSERYEYRPAGTPEAPDWLINRRPRTDAPARDPHAVFVTAGRYPAHVGATWSLDGTRPADAL